MAGRIFVDQIPEIGNIPDALYIREEQEKYSEFYKIRVSAWILVRGEYHPEAKKDGWFVHAEPVIIDGSQQDGTVGVVDNVERKHEYLSTIPAIQNTFAIYGVTKSGKPDEIVGYSVGV